jgi:hypothetical protein
MTHYKRTIRTDDFNFDALFLVVSEKETFMSYFMYIWDSENGIPLGSRGWCRLLTYGGIAIVERFTEEATCNLMRDARLFSASTGKFQHLFEGIVLPRGYTKLVHSGACLTEYNVINDWYKDNDGRDPFLYDQVGVSCAKARAKYLEMRGQAVTAIKETLELAPDLVEKIIGLVFDLRDLEMYNDNVVSPVTTVKCGLYKWIVTI